MALCDLCQRVPFNNLPEFPNSDGGFRRIADDSSLPEFDINLNMESKYPLGFPWHESLEALTASAKLDCPLCILVDAGAQAWLHSYRKAETTNEHFIKYSLDIDPIPYGEMLWITKRRGGGAGFAVLVRNPKLRAFVLLTGISFSVGGDHPLAQQYLHRPIERYSGSSQSLDVATRWVEQCADSHEECASCDTPFPSRVLDVDASGDSIKLVEPEAGSVGRYACLSHCWGSSVPLTTTRQTRQARASGISISELPRTFHDAVVIARRLSIRYLWIDSLCIYQDDRADWARESASMTAVYSNAYVVIAADHASDGNRGCFHTRPPRPGSEIFITGLGDIYGQVVDNADECPWVHGFEGEPLAARGWALQESVLATRILHFARTQMHFECNRGRISEDECCDRVDFRRRLMEFKRAPTERSKDENRELWYSLLWDYGGRKLTRVTDKLPAMSGLAKMFNTCFGTLYVAGLWSDALIEGLAWQCLGPYVPMSTDEYTGPSWSWASFGGIAATVPRGRSLKAMASVEEWNIELQDEENPYGAVRSAWVRISCPMAQLDHSEGNDPSDWESRRLKAPWLAVRTAWPGTEETKVLRLDHRASSGPQGDWRKWDLSVIILAGLRYFEDGDAQGTSIVADNEKVEDSDLMDTYFGLAVIPVVDGSRLQWKRVGWLYLGREEAGKIIYNKEAWAAVTLV